MALNRTANILNFDGTQIVEVGTVSFTDDTASVVPARNGAAKVTAIAAPGTGNIAASECFLWFDNTNGAGKLMVQAKTANGTLVSGSVTLT